MYRFEKCSQCIITSSYPAGWIVMPAARSPAWISTSRFQKELSFAATYQAGLFGVLQRVQALNVPLLEARRCV